MPFCCDLPFGCPPCVRCSVPAVPSEPSSAHVTPPLEVITHTAARQNRQNLTLIACQLNQVTCRKRSPDMQLPAAAAALQAVRNLALSACCTSMTTAAERCTQPCTQGANLKLCRPSLSLPPPPACPFWAAAWWLCSAETTPAASAVSRFSGCRHSTAFLLASARHSHQRSWRLPGNKGAKACTDDPLGGALNAAPQASTVEYEWNVGVEHACAEVLLYGMDAAC